MRFQVVRIAAWVALSIVSAGCSTKVLLHGTVRDRTGAPRSACVVEAKTPGFATIAKARCDVDGKYQLRLQKQKYNGIFICDDSYGKESLEFWAWNLKLDQDLQLDAAFDKLEVYDLSVWNSKGGPISFFVSFRPMSLDRMKEQPHERFAEHPNMYKATLNDKEITVYDIAPKLDKDHINVSLDGTPALIQSLQWYYLRVDQPGFSSPYYFPVCLLQVQRGELKQGKHLVRVRAQDIETGAIGEAVVQFESNSEGFGF